jgi:hypothetical protein
MKLPSRNKYQPRSCSRIDEHGRNHLPDCYSKPPGREGREGRQEREGHQGVEATEGRGEAAGGDDSRQREGKERGGREGGTR